MSWTELNTYAVELWQGYWRCIEGGLSFQAAEAAARQIAKDVGSDRVSIAEYSMEEGTSALSRSYIDGRPPSW